MQRTIVTLLLVVAGLTCADLVRDILVARTEAYGQAVGIPAGGYIVVTGVDESGNVPVVDVLDPREQTLGAYTTKKTGIDFLGSRRITWDLQSDELSFPAKATRKDKSPTLLKKMLLQRGHNTGGSGSSGGSNPKNPKNKNPKNKSSHDNPFGRQESVIVRGPESLLGL